MPIAQRAAEIVSENTRKWPSPAVETTRPPSAASSRSIRSRCGVSTCSMNAWSRSVSLCPGISPLRSTEPTISVNKIVFSSAIRFHHPALTHPSIAAREPDLYSLLPLHRSARAIKKPVLPPAAGRAKSARP